MVWFFSTRAFTLNFSSSFTASCASLLLIFLNLVYFFVFFAKNFLKSHAFLPLKWCDVSISIFYFAIIFQFQFHFHFMYHIVIKSTDTLSLSPLLLCLSILSSFGAPLWTAANPPSSVRHHSRIDLKKKMSGSPELTGSVQTRLG